MNDLLERLKNDFADFSCYAGKDGSLVMRTDWRGKTDEIQSIRIYLSGTDPLTGKPLSRSFFETSIDRLSTIPLMTRPLKLYGEYRLHFEAIDLKGRNLGSFRETMPIRIKNEKVRPFFQYSISAASKEWDRLEVKTNCWPLCCGHVWAISHGRKYLLQGNVDARGELVLYFPEGMSRELLRDDTRLPPLKNTDMAAQREGGNKNGILLRAVRKNAGQ